MKQDYLTILFSRYAKGLYSRSKFEGLAYQYLMKNQDKTYLNQWKFNEYEDFLSWFYQRLHKAIDSYSEAAGSFDGYIYSVMRKAAKEYHVKTTTKSVIEYSAWSAHVPDLYVQDEGCVYQTEKLLPAEASKKILSSFFNEQKSLNNPRQLLALILKCYYYVSDDLIEKIAHCIGINKEILTAMLKNIRVLRQKKDDQIYRMKERIHCQYYRCIVYEKRLSYITENTTTHTRLKQQLEKARVRLEKMRQRMASIRTDASNGQIAKIIGVSKGTVDSSLYRLKNKRDAMSDK